MYYDVSKYENTLIKRRRNIYGLKESGEGAIKREDDARFSGSNKNDI